MRVKLPGIAVTRARLATGQRITYYYAWRGGPRLVGEPGSPEFLRSYEAAHRNKRTPNPSTFFSIIAGYKASDAFNKRIRERTRADYLKQLAKIEAEFGDLPLAALEDPRVTREFLDWRDRLSGSQRQADYAWTVLMRVISWARENTPRVSTVILTNGRNQPWKENSFRNAWGRARKRAGAIAKLERGRT